MIEVVKNSELFHESRNEVERRLAVLNTIFELGIIAAKAETKILEVEKIEHLADDVWHGQILEDSAIRLPCQKPKPGHHLRTVVSEEPLVSFSLREAAHVAADISWRAIRKLEEGQPDFGGGNLRERYQELVEGDPVLKRKYAEAGGRTLAGPTAEAQQ